MMKRKGFLQMSFAWIFALVVGAFILFLAFYVAGKFMGSAQKEQDAIVSKEIGVLLSPLEIGFEESKTTYLELPKRTRITPECTKEEPFGKQHMFVSEETLGSWSDTYTDLVFPNKYVFVDKMVEGKKFYLFDLPFDFPYKVADVIIITSMEDQYCFLEAPLEVLEKIISLKLENVHNASLLSQCPDGSKIICFGAFRDFCEAKVDIFPNSDYSGRVVKRNEGTVDFEGEALMYAAIFSDPQTYQCQLKRLMQRTEKLGILYSEKATFITRRGCTSGPNLLPLIGQAESFNDSRDLDISLMQTVEDIKQRNDNNQRCALW